MKASKFGLAILAAVALAMSVTSPADAALRLRISDGNGNGVVITDGGPGDLDGNTNAIAFLGTIGAFNMNFTAGTSTSVPNTTQPGFYDAIDVVSLNASSTTGGTLQIVLEQDSFGNAPDGSLVLAQVIGGTLSGAFGSSVTFDGYANAGNLVPTLGTDGYYGSVSNTVPPNPPIFGGPIPVIPDLPPAGSASVTGGAAIPLSNSSPIAFTVGGSTGFTKSGPYSLFSSATIVLNGGGSVSFNQLTGTNPAPAGLLLFAAAVPALAFVRRKKAVQA